MVKLILRKPDPEKWSTWYFEELEKESKEPGSFYMDGYLLNNLKAAKHIIRDDFDMVFVAEGQVGAGKSVFVMQAAYYCSNGALTMDDICFDAISFRKRVLQAKKYHAIVFDEAFRGLSARATLSLVNKTLMSMMQEIRQKNLFIFIVLPSIWDLDSFIAMHRCQGMFTVEWKGTATGRERGYFKFFDKNQLMFYLKDRQKYKYGHMNKPNFFGRFTNFYPIDEATYKTKKEGALGSYDPVAEKEESNSVRSHKKDEKIRVSINRLMEKGDSAKEIAKLYGISDRQVYKLAQIPQEELDLYGKMGTQGSKIDRYIEATGEYNLENEPDSTENEEEVDKYLFVDPKTKEEEDENDRE